MRKATRTPAILSPRKGRSGPGAYSAKLLAGTKHRFPDHLPKPGLDLRKAFGFVRDDVLKKTGYKQEPYVYGSLGGEDVPLVAAKPTPPTGAQADPQAAVRRDYELALQLATRDGWEAFLSQYTDGFYANLAKGQLKKIAADEARQTATEKARLAEQETARLAAEGARQVEMAKAVATARAAEAARVVADRAKQIEQEKTAAAERARIASEKAAADKVEAEKAAADKLAAEKTAATKAGEKIASLTHLPDPATPTVVTKSVQLELRRVGCLKGAPDGEWNTSSQRSMSLFNRYAGTNFDAKLASLDAFDAIKAKPSRVCPLVCDPGYRTDGDSCVKITCRTGFELDENNSCKRIEKKRPPLAKLDEKASEIQPKTQTGDGSCGRTKDPLRCSCALKHGGYIYPNTRSSSGYSWRSNGSSDFFMCLHSAGRR